MDGQQQALELLNLKAQFAAINKVQAIIEFNMDGTILTANENFLNVMGYSLEEIQGQHHSMFAEPAFAASAEYKEFWQKLNRGEFEAKEYKRLGKNGKEVWIQASYNPIFDLEGNPYKVVKFANDVTKEKLRNADYAGQIAAIGKAQAVIEFEMDGTIITANDNFLNTMGYTLAEIKGQHHRIFAEPAYAASAEYQEFWQSLRQGNYDTNEYKRLGKNGREVWIQASYNPIFDLNGKPFKVVKYATNITGRKQAIETIKSVLFAMSEGDLTQSINQKLEGEFNVIADAMNQFINTLNDMVSNIRNTSASVYRSSREISEGNLELSNRTEAQASSLEETASAMEELTSTVQQNAANLNDASKLSATVLSKASDGGEVVKNTIMAMSGIDKSSKKIADIIGVIDEIAFQTNLLALNAAVEAARAGEQGRGFAVVAAEVRNLAQRSAGAAKEIKGLINDSVEAVNQGIKLVDATGETFEQLVAAINDVSQMILDIESAGKEQAAGISEVSAAVSQMDELTQKNAALAEESTAASKTMEDLAQGLLEQIEFFESIDESAPLVKRQEPVKPLKPNRPAARSVTTRKTVSDQEWDEF